MGDQSPTEELSGGLQEYVNHEQEKHLKMLQRQKFVIDERAINITDGQVDQILNSVNQY